MVLGNWVNVLRGRLCRPIFGSKDTEALRDHHKLGQRRGFDLFHHAMTMRFDRPFGRTDLTCDLLVHFAPHHPFKDLALAGAEASVARGAALLAAYSTGLGLPFLAAALAMGPFARFLKRARSRFAMVEKAMGGLLVLTGIAFLTGWITTASFWLLEAFPALGRLG